MNQIGTPTTEQEAIKEAEISPTDLLSIGGGGANILLRALARRLIAKPIASVGFKFGNRILRGLPGEIHSDALRRLFHEGEIPDELYDNFADFIEDGFISKAGKYLTRDQAERKVGGWGESLRLMAEGKMRKPGEK